MATPAGAPTAASDSFTPPASPARAKELAPATAPPKSKFEPLKKLLDEGQISAQVYENAVQKLLEAESAVAAAAATQRFSIEDLAAGAATAASAAPAPRWEYASEHGWTSYDTSSSAILEQEYTTAKQGWAAYDDASSAILEQEYIAALGARRVSSVRSDREAEAKSNAAAQKLVEVSDAADKTAPPPPFVPTVTKKKRNGDKAVEVAGGRRQARKPGLPVVAVRKKSSTNEPDAESEQQSPAAAARPKKSKREKASPAKNLFGRKLDVPPLEHLEKRLADGLTEKAALRGQSVVKLACVEFARFDSDGNGSLDEFEFKEALRSLGILLNGAEISALMRRLDDDGDGTISLVELESRLWNVRLKSLKGKLRSVAYFGSKMNLAKLFKAYDRDNSGSLEYKEFSLVIRRDAKLKVSEVPDAELKEIFKHVDTDNSGGISKDEFIALLDPGSADAEASKERFESASGRVCHRILSRAEEMNLGQQKQLIHMFERYADDAGHLTRQTFRKAVMELGVTLSKDELTSVLADIDEDGDEEISSEEFLARLRLAKTDAHMQGADIQKTAGSSSALVVVDDADDEEPLRKPKAKSKTAKKKASPKKQSSPQSRKAALPSVPVKKSKDAAQTEPELDQSPKKRRTPKKKGSPRPGVNAVTGRKLVVPSSQALEKRLYDALTEKAALRKQSVVKLARVEFQRFDGDGNGTLDEFEFKEALRSLNVSMNPSEIR